VVVPPYLKRTEAAPEDGAGLLAESLSVTERLAVEALPPLIDMVPLGTTLSTNQLRVAGVASVLPVASLACTLKVWLPWLKGPG
jgi:hypothetical protein